jgi:sugar lactone lactonase YvrE
VTIYDARAASAETFILGEGPVWDAALNRVLWVDINRGEVLEGILADDAVELTGRHSFDGTVGAVAPAADGRLLVAGQEELVVVSRTGGRTRGPRIVPAGIGSRTNDGATDPAGHFVIGTLALETREGQEGLYRVEDNGVLTVIDDDLWLSNGIAWSADGSLLYTVDTIPQVVWVRDYNVRTGAIGARREHIRVTDGLPDGICMDTAGNLWIAMWGAGEVRCYAPDGAVLDLVRVRAPHTSSVAFVGPDRDLLLITTAQQGLTSAQLDEYPDSGRLFTARVNAVGVATTAWSGSWAAPISP